MMARGGDMATIYMLEGTYMLDMRSLIWDFLAGGSCLVKVAVPTFTLYSLMPFRPE